MIKNMLKNLEMFSFNYTFAETKLIILWILPLNLLIW